MKILILGNQTTIDTYSDYYDLYTSYVEDSLPSAGEHTVDVAFLDDLFIELGEGIFNITVAATKKHLSEYDLVFARGIKFRPYMEVLKVVSIYCQQRGITMVNDYSAGRSGSKLAQAIQFYSHNLPIPYTIYLNRGVMQSLEDLPLVFPMVMKAELGTRGENNFLVGSKDEIRQHYQEHEKLNFVLQHAIPNDGDYRLLIVGEHAELIHRKAVGDSHLNNTSQGATATLKDLDTIPTDLRKTIDAYLKAYKLVTGGVDVLQDSQTGDWYILEVNSQPQLTTGAFLEKKRELFATYLKSLSESRG